MRALGKFDIVSARFYAACVASALNHMHERKIVYRAVKPENVLLDADGYVKVVDFGFAKRVPERTWTLCGTPDYLAPEIIQQKGHNKASDWWSFGVYVYEMLAGCTPFASHAHAPMDMFKAILEAPIAYPWGVADDAKAMIGGLLDRNPVSRLGNLGLAGLDVVEADFFADLSFAELERRSVPAPYIPDLSSQTDDKRLDDYYL